MMNFEETLHNDLLKYLQAKDEIDHRMPECPDIEELWPKIGEAYLQDGVREFQNYPVVSLGWMMYVGMALVKLWDTEWEIYGKIDDLYSYLRDKRGYDLMDEYVRQEVLLLKGDDFTALERLTGDCASRVYNLLRHQPLEPGTPEAFRAYVACLHQLYLMGMAIQLKRMGYTTTLVSPEEWGD